MRKGLKQLNVYIPVTLCDRVKDQAENECTSMATIVRRALDEYCGRFEVPAGPKLGRRVLQESSSE